jgi:hypothetical protein
MRLKQEQCIPPFRWFLTWIQEYHDGSEYRIAILKLPSWQWKQDIYWQEFRWHQLAIVYHGKTGFRTTWMATPDSGTGGEQ